MKKLLILAVLALGLCASPALAETIYFADLNFESPDPHSSYHTLPSDPASYIALGAIDMFDGWSITPAGAYAYVGHVGLPSVYFYTPTNAWDNVSSISFYASEGLKMYIQDFYGDHHTGYTRIDLGSVASSDLITIDLSAYKGNYLLGFSNMFHAGDDPSITLISMEYSPASSAVPVPAAVWLLGTGVAGVAALRRKFK